jgi:hypothetical protein
LLTLLASLNDLLTSSIASIALIIAIASFVTQSRWASIPIILYSVFIIWSMISSIQVSNLAEQQIAMGHIFVYGIIASFLILFFREPLKE